MKVDKPRDEFADLIANDFFIDNPNGHDIRDELNKFLAAYDALQADGIHTCHDKCQRDACVAGRERDEQKQYIAILEKNVSAWNAMADKHLAEVERLKSQASQFESTLTETMRMRDEYKAENQSLKEIEWKYKELCK